MIKKKINLGIERNLEYKMRHRPDGWGLIDTYIEETGYTEDGIYINRRKNYRELYLDTIIRLSKDSEKEYNKIKKEQEAKLKLMQEG